MTTEKQSNTQAERTPLTPQQMQRRKKMFVYPILFLMFAGAMWLIFAPKGEKEAGQRAGLNTDLPTPEENGIINDKREAYVQADMNAKRQERMRSLNDFSQLLGEERQVHITPDNVSNPETPEDNDSSYGANRAFQSSASAYEDVNRQLGDFYTEMEAPPADTVTGAMASRIEQLELRLAEQQAAKDAEDEQLRLIEQSYAVAARYNMAGAGSADGNVPAVQAATANGKAPVQPVAQVRREVVSLLSAPMSDAEFIDAYSRPRNMGFLTAAGNERTQGKNSIRACVYRTVTVADGQEVGLRLLEPMLAGDYLIPENTVITGAARIEGERMAVTIEAVQHEGNVIPVELTVYDLDGGRGIFVPDSDEINVFKEIAAGMGTGMGSSITITDNAGSQLLADLGRSAIQGASQYVGQKMRDVRVTLKTGYRVLLFPPLK
jgi:conjugative transposon TraM protein